MLKSSLVLMVVLLTILVKGQNHIKDYVVNFNKPISNVNPDSTNYSDLETIGNAIGDARIVMLGEQDHGDATAFLAKTRVIKYLHEKKGFNVLAFESDFFGLNYGWDKLEKTKDSIISFIHGNIFGVWTACSACKQLLFQYIPDSYQSNNPIILTGFDLQMFLSFSYRNLLFKFDSILNSYQLPITKSPNYASEILPLINSIYNINDADANNKYDKRESSLSEILKELKAKLPEAHFWIKVTENLIELNLYYKYMQSDFRKTNNIRDKQMAENLKWICDNKYPKEKIIVWAANAHVAKYSGSSGKSNEKKLIAMGSFFTNDSSLNKETYIIGFTSYEGETGRMYSKKFAIPKPNSNGFENWINKDYNYAFVDFKNYNQSFPDDYEAFYLKGLAHNSAFKEDWTKIFDGIFFIKEMQPCQQ